MITPPPPIVCNEPAYVTAKASPNGVVYYTCYKEKAPAYQYEFMTITGPRQANQGPKPSNETVGHPNKDAAYWAFSNVDGMCGPASVSIVLAINHINQTPMQVAQSAYTRGLMAPLVPGYTGPPDWYGPSLGYGLPGGGAAMLLDTYTLPAAAESQSFAWLETELQAGQTPIVQLDDETIMQDTPDPELADHDMVVTGYDPSDERVFVDDPGMLAGRAESIPLATFQASWATSNDFAVYLTAN